MKNLTINDLVNANAKAKRIDAATAAKYYKNFYHLFMAVEGRQLQKSEKTAILGLAMEKHNVLERDERNNKARVLLLNGLKNGKLPFKTTKPELLEAFNVVCVNGELEKCEMKTSYNMDKLYTTVDRTIVRLRRMNKKNNNK